MQAQPVNIFATYMTEDYVSKCVSSYIWINIPRLSNGQNLEKIVTKGGIQTSKKPREKVLIS